MSPLDPNQPPDGHSDPPNPSSSPPPCNLLFNSSNPSQLGTTPIINNNPANFQDQLPSFTLNSEDLSYEHLSSSPSCLRQKRPHPLQNQNQDQAKIPRLNTSSQPIPFNLNPDTQFNQLDQTNEYILQARDLILKACSSCKSHDR